MTVNCNPTVNAPLHNFINILYVCKAFKGKANVLVRGFLFMVVQYATLVKIEVKRDIFNKKEHSIGDYKGCYLLFQVFRLQKMIFHTTLEGFQIIGRREYVGMK